MHLWVTLLVVRSQRDRPSSRKNLQSFSHRHGRHVLASAVLCSVHANSAVGLAIASSESSE